MPKVKLGDYNVTCDITGFKVPASQCKMQWNGLFVRKKSWSPRFQQDYLVKSKPDKQRVPIARPEATDKFLATNEVTRDDL